MRATTHTHTTDTPRPLFRRKWEKEFSDELKAFSETNTNNVLGLDLTAPRSGLYEGKTSESDGAAQEVGWGQGERRGFVSHHVLTTRALAGPP